MAEPAPIEVVILAAGEGKRMKSARPKVLLPLADRPLLAHVLDTARALSPRAIHVVYGRGGDQVRAAFGTDQDLTWSHQAQQLGTGHAVQQAMPQVGSDALVLVLYADAPLLRAQTLAELCARAADGPAVLVARLADPFGYGRVILDADLRVRAIVEQRDATPAQQAIDLVNSGIVAASAADLQRWLGALRNDNAQGEYYLTDIFALAAREGRPAHALICRDPEEIAGANDPVQLADLEWMLNRRRVHELMRASGLRARVPESLNLIGTLECGPDVELDVHVQLLGHNVLGEGVRIGPFCVLRDCALAPGTRVHSHSSLDGVVTHGPCDIGPFARLRPGTELAAGARIGNFVETKNTRLGEGSKANHLSYLGDADLGRHVNVGAGTITCNYDGVNKHRTQIGDDAFIGSNSSLVAPVSIGKEATIGAGSVITRTAPEAQLSVARARQTTIAGWKRPKRKPKD